MGASQSPRENPWEEALNVPTQLERVSVTEGSGLQGHSITQEQQACSKADQQKTQANQHSTIRQ